VIKLIEVTKDLVCEKYLDQILNRRIEQLCDSQIPLAIVLWAECTSLEESNKNQVSIYICCSIAYTDKNHKF